MTRTIELMIKKEKRAVNPNWEAQMSEKVETGRYKSPNEVKKQRRPRVTQTIARINTDGPSVVGLIFLDFKKKTERKEDWKPYKLNKCSYPFALSTFFKV